VNDGLSVVARLGAPRRILLIGLLGLLIPVLAISGGLRSLHLGAAAQPATQTGPLPPGIAGLLKLPPSARPAVSAAIGAQDPYYRARLQGGAAVFQNGEQQLSARFTPAAASVSSHSLTLDLRATAIGHGSALAAIPPASPAIAGNRVTYSHPSLSEWFLNGPLGIEQGFTLARRPASGGRAEPLTIELALPAGVHARVHPGGSAVVLSMPGHRSVTYGSLLATDARGRRLPGRLVVSGERLLLQIEDAGASYPLTIDPLVQEGGILEGGPEEIEVHDGKESVRGGLGYSVALSADGHTALVGAPNFNSFSGAVWVFVESHGQWVRQGKLDVPSSGGGTECKESAGGEEATSEECAFGRAVAISADGNTAVIGGPRTNTFAGAAWVFTRTNGEWTLAQELTGGPEENVQARFGRDVAISPDASTIAVGATADAGTRGAIYVFDREEAPGSPPAWSHQGPRLLASGTVGESHLGVSLALSEDGSTLIGGAPGDDGYVGAAWIFARSGSGPAATWSQVGGKLTGGEESGAGHFGFSVALSAEGTTALVGARADDGGAGAAWAFTDQSGSWAQQGPKLTGGGEEVGEGHFGYSVALSASGESALIGAPRDDLGVGAAWVFALSGATGNWEQQGEKLTAELEPDGSGATPIGKGGFGTSVALAGSGITAMVGSPFVDNLAGGAWAFSQPAFIPDVRSVTPDAGPLGGGTPVRITGERFSGASSVSFGEVPARFSANPDGSLTATAPAHTPGSVCVVVTTPEGASEGAHCPKFTYLPKPRIETITPKEGPTGGTAAIVITGHSFTDTSSVTFGESPALSYTVNSPQQITAVAPAGEEGEVPVTVTTPGGTATGGLAQWYLYQPPMSATLGYTSRQCTVALVSHRATVDRKARARLRLAGPGSSPCSGRLRLRARVSVKVREGHSSRVRSALMSIGTTTFTLAPHATSTVVVSLNSEGRALLRADGGSLQSSLLIAGARDGNAATRTATVRLSMLKVTVSRASREARRSSAARTGRR